MTYAKVICDSVSPLGVRLTSIELQFPRFILPQVLMHRVWSRSCESLRARPVASKLSEVESDPYRPSFARNQKGMAAGAELEQAEQVIAQGAWSDAHRACVKAAKELAEIGAHKQWANRLLEPFAYQKMLVTSTDFANFLRLRCADDAQPEIAELACKMRDALAESTPKRVGDGMWHRPYVGGDSDRYQLAHLAEEGLNSVSAARVARVSYCQHDGRRDVGKDITLADTLIASGHSNPFEAVCTPAPDCRRYANHRGWISFRYVMEQDGRLPQQEGQ